MKREILVLFILVNQGRNVKMKCFWMEFGTEERIGGLFRFAYLHHGLISGFWYRRFMPVSCKCVLKRVEVSFSDICEFWFLFRVDLLGV